MNTISSINALAAAALIGIAAESAGSEPATPKGAAASIAQRPAPASASVPGWYAPPPRPGGYVQAGQQPSPWPAPPPAYGQWPPYYMPYGRYRPATATAAENPLSTELRQTQEQLTAKTAELDTAHATVAQIQLKLQLSLEAERTLNERLAALQAELRAATEVLQQVQTETAVSSRQLDTAMTQADTLGKSLAELSDRLENQKTTLGNALQIRAAEQDSAHYATAGRDEQPTAPKAELQAAKEVLQQVQADTNQPTRTAGSFVNELTELKAQLENQKTTLRNTGHTLATVAAERDGLLADMSAVVAERDKLKHDLAACRRQLAGAGGH